MTPFGDIPYRRAGICKEGLEEGTFSVAEGFPQMETILFANVTCGASDSNGGYTAFLVPPWVFAVWVVASFVEEEVRCEAECLVELFGSEVGVGRGGDGGDGRVADERGPVVMFCVVDDPSFARSGTRVGAGKMEGVEEPCVVRAKGERE
jgi:hypothetical protein